MAQSSHSNWNLQKNWHSWQKFADHKYILYFIIIIIMIIIESDYATKEIYIFEKLVINQQ